MPIMPSKRRQAQPPLEDSRVKGDESDNQASSASDEIVKGEEKDMSEVPKASLMHQKSENEALKATLTHQENEKKLLETSLTHQENESEILKTSLVYEKNENEALKASLVHKQKEKKVLESYRAQQKNEIEALKASLIQQEKENKAMKSTLADYRATDDSDFELELSQEQMSSLILPKKTSPGSRLSQSSKSAIRNRDSRRIPQPNNSQVSGPDFIFPSMHEENSGGSWSAGRQPRIPQVDQQRRRKATRTQPSPRGKEPAVPSNSSSNVADMGLPFLGRVAGWGLDVAGDALHVLKKPIAVVLAVCFFVGLLIVVQNAVLSSLTTALSPLCHIPGVSYLPIPVCHGIPSTPKHDTSTPTHSIDREFSDLLTLSTKFDDLLTQSADGASLPFQISRSEASIRDLRQVVRFSDLQSKKELGVEFDLFVELVGIASFDLQCFNSHVARAVDSLLASARWTSRILNDATHRKEPRGLIPIFIKSTVLAPFQSRSLSFNESILLKQYLSYSATISDEIQRLIDEGQLLVTVLRSLERNLETIHGIAVRDSLDTQASKDQVLATLWAILGCRRGDLRGYDTELELLKQVSKYREQAFTHVSGTILKLQGMRAELAGMKERIRRTDLVGERQPLSVHLEEMTMGIERLERAKFEGRRIEGEQLKKALVIEDRIVGEPLSWKKQQRSVGR